LAADLVVFLPHLPKYAERVSTGCGHGYQEAAKTNNESGSGVPKVALQAGRNVAFAFPPLADIE